MLNACICTIGDELLIGQVTDTNSPFIARALGEIGVKVNSMVSIQDSADQIVKVLDEKLHENDIVITTGGLGPTKDDITKEALSTLTNNSGWHVDEGQLKVVHEILGSRGLDVLDINKAQARVPDTCEVIVNRRGTAPVMVFRIGRSVLYSLPGVPFETEAAFPDVIEDIKNHFPTGYIIHRNIMTYGMAESALSKKIQAWEDSLPANMKLAYLPDPLKGVRLRLSLYGGNAGDEAEMDRRISQLKDILGDLVYALSDESLEQVIGERLKALGATLSAAESCTGGEIAHLITTVPGSSAYFLGSVTSYAPEVKVKVLGVSADTIKNKGIVSSEVASEMALGVKKLTGSDYSVATTGYAGPGGGDSVNPEGTVWVAVATPEGIFTRKFCYRNDRKRNIQRFAASALYFLLRSIS